MNKSEAITKFQENKEIFIALCSNHNWQLEVLAPNKLNSNQYIAKCLDEDGMPRNILRTESGKFIELLGGKKWKEFSYGPETIQKD